MALAVVRPMGTAKQFQTPSAQALEDFEQELVDQYCLARAGAGLTDHYIGSERASAFGFIRQVGRRLGTSPRNIRTDRTVQEVQATGGDVRRICDMFGLTVHGATPYVATLEHPDLTDPARPR
jgi:hypothetical protein